MSTNRAFEVDSILIDEKTGLVAFDIDPITVGFSAPIGSLGMRTNGLHYRKTGAANIDWTLIDDQTAAEIEAIVSHDNLLGFVSGEHFLQSVISITLSQVSDSGSAAALDTGISSGNIPLIGAGNVLPTSIMPALTITETYVVASEAAQLALTVQEGDVAVRTDENKSYIALNDVNADMGDWQELLSPTGAVTSVFGRTGPVTAEQADYDSFFLTPAEGNAAYLGIGAKAADSELLDGISSSVFLQTESFFYYNADVQTVENASPQYWILCRNMGSNDVNGQLRIDRTSGNFQAASLDIVVTATTVAVIGGSLVTNQYTQSSEVYELVTLTLTADANSYVAIKYTGNTYPKSTSRFTGYLRNSGSNTFVAVDSSGVSNVVSLPTTNSKHTFTGTVNGRDIAADGTKLDAIGFPTGTLMLFQQTSAPTGWTKQTTHNNKALRIVSGTAGSGGSVAFTTVFGSARATTGVTLSASQSGVPTHGHPFRWSKGLTFTGAGYLASGSIEDRNTYTNIETLSVAGNTTQSAASSHAHTSNLAVQYVDLIIARKN